MKLEVIKEFSNSPYGRSPDKVMKGEEDTTGSVFREKYLAPRLKKAIEKKQTLKVILTGYNRYGRSFLDEAFGGLIRDNNFKYDDLETYLEIIHDDVRSIVDLSWSRIRKADCDKKEIQGQIDEDYNDN